MLAKEGALPMDPLTLAGALAQDRGLRRLRRQLGEADQVLVELGQ